VRRKCDGTDNVVMLEGVGNFARMGVPYFAADGLANVGPPRQITYAVKSAEAVAAYCVSGESRAW
jgi:hypothetical protein